MPTLDSLTHRFRSGARGASTKGDLAPPWTPHFREA